MWMREGVTVDEGGRINVYEGGESMWMREGESI